MVTNGQEELASLAYLITMAFIEANGPHIRKTGDLYHEEMRRLAERHPDLCVGVAGDAHMTALHFHRVEDATAFLPPHGAGALRGHQRPDLQAQLPARPR